MKIDFQGTAHLIEQDTSQGSGWQPADPVRRRIWHQARARQESRYVSSSPDGPYFVYGDLMLRPAVAAARWSLKLTGLAARCRRRAHGIRLAELEIVRPDLPAQLDGYRILHITDPHFDDAPDLAQRIVELVAALSANPAIDLCAITG